MHSSLVMQDKETDSYWSIMKSEAVAGPLKGTSLKEIPRGEKIRWRQWVERHPDTLVWSTHGREDIPKNAYQDYFTSSQTFGGARASDSRLDSKEPIFAFTLDEKDYAITLEDVEGGIAFDLKDKAVFLFRPVDSPVYQSTLAFQASSGRFQKRGDHWVHTESGLQFDPQSASFSDGSDSPVSRMTGFDTFWYTWSPFHERTKILRD